MTFIQQKRLIIPKKVVVFLVKMPFFKQGICVLERNPTMFSKVPTINKRKHPKKGKKVQDGRSWVLAKKKTTNVGRLQGEHEQIKY